MALKNYTSTVPAMTSISHIERCLARHGAKQILKDIEDQRVTGISWTMDIQGITLPFKLPARVKECEEVLRGETTSRTRPETLKKIPAQAERTAWKIVLDWVEAQMAMIELSQVEFLQIFLPYVYDPAKDETFYEKVVNNDMKLLTSSK